MGRRSESAILVVWHTSTHVLFIYVRYIYILYIREEHKPAKESVEKKQQQPRSKNPIMGRRHLSLRATWLIAVHP